MEEWDYVYKIECIHKQSLINQGLEFCEINIDVSLCYSCTMKQSKEIKCKVSATNTKEEWL